ncbi:hypothetical protein CC86DRAFT_282137, partial [Ophiobolus disseminans]
YFAYGSNMYATVFLERRGICLLKSLRACLETWCLCFNVLFLPYRDPGMASLRERTGDCDGISVHGVALLLSAADFIKLIISEGASVAYKVVDATAHPLNGAEQFEVRTLVARQMYRFQSSRCPSERYMGSLAKGESEQKLPPWYQNHLSNIRVFRASDSKRWKLGRWLFETQWQPITSLVARGTRRFKDEAGNVSAWYLLMFDILLYSMWTQHDMVFAPIFGRRDGR